MKLVCWSLREASSVSHFVLHAVLLRQSFPTDRLRRQFFASLGSLEAVACTFRLRRGWPYRLRRPGLYMVVVVASRLLVVAAFVHQSPEASILSSFPQEAFPLFLD